jgi:hypothetical protein
MIGAIQTFGDLIHWYSHVHTVVSEGVFTESGHFVHISETCKHRAFFFEDSLTSTSLMNCSMGSAAVGVWVRLIRYIAILLC